MQRRHYVVIIGCLLLGGSLYALAGLLKPQMAQQSTVFAPSGESLEPSATTSAPLGPHQVAPAGQTEYYNEHYRFSLLYPNELKVNERDEGQGASTVTFQDSDAGVGFQIFVVPYGASQVTEEQFKKDEPSGVRTSVSNANIDGATAASFYGKDIFLGDTAEIWFIHGGYLFEVTTLKPTANWLGNIMQTWKFL